ncbi:hypothetical protein JCM16303_005199 [Sporobolomyces ruberrimus]
MSSRIISFLAALATLLSLVYAVAGQGHTTITDESGATETTSVSATVYTTNGEAYTFVPSTPSTPTPSIRSFGSIQNLQDYMASRSNRGVAGSAPPVTATAVIGGGGTNKNNIVQANSGPCTRVRAPWRMVEIPVVFAGTLWAIQVVL